MMTVLAGALGFYTRRLQDEREEEARSLRENIEQLYGRLATSDIPVEGHVRSDFYASFRSDLASLVTKHFDRVRVSDYMRDPLIHQQVRGEVEWVRKMYMGPEAGGLEPPLK